MECMSTTSRQLTLCIVTSQGLVPVKNTGLRPCSINVHFACTGEALIVVDARHARVSRFSKPAPPARAKRLQWKIAFSGHRPRKISLVAILNCLIFPGDDY